MDLLAPIGICSSDPFSLIFPFLYILVLTLPNLCFSLYPKGKLNFTYLVIFSTHNSLFSPLFSIFCLVKREGRVKPCSQSQLTLALEREHQWLHWHPIWLLVSSCRHRWSCLTRAREMSYTWNSEVAGRLDHNRGTTTLLAKKNNNRPKNWQLREKKKSTYKR